MLPPARMPIGPPMIPITPPSRAPRPAPQSLDSVNFALPSGLTGAVGGVAELVRERAADRPGSAAGAVEVPRSSLPGSCGWRQPCDLPSARCRHGSRFRQERFSSTGRRELFDERVEACPNRVADQLDLVGGDRQRRRNGERVPRARRITPWGRIARYALAGSAGSAASASGSKATPARAPVPPRTSPTSGWSASGASVSSSSSSSSPPALDQPLPLEDLDVREPGRARGCVPGVRLAVADGHAPGLGPERLGDPSGDDDAAEREIAARHALCEGDEVGLDAEALEPEPAAEPAEAADHRVADEEHAGLAADHGDLLDVALGRRQHAAGPDHGLAEERGDALGPDRSSSSGAPPASPTAPGTCSATSGP